MNGRRADFVTGSDAFLSHFPHVSRETLARLGLYESLLRQWQPAVNLVSPTTLDHIWHRHFADSAQLLALAPPAARNWLDLGAGAGFPGLVLAILLVEREDSHVTLIESDARKAAFLREVARRTQAPATILVGRIENAATQFTLPPMDVVTARALAPLPRLLDLAHGFFGPRTVGLFLKGKSAVREVVEAHEFWAFEPALVPSSTDTKGRIVVVRGLSRKAA